MGALEAMHLFVCLMARAELESAHVEAETEQCLKGAQ